MKKIISSTLFSCVFLLFISCSNNSTNTIKPAPIDTSLKMIFIELGSDNCIPCKEMRPVMDSIQKKYGSQIIVKFIDVIRNSKAAEQYKVIAMPTQVFLDTNNIELHRHIGFYTEDSIHLFIQSKGLKIIIN
ncbi:MAG: thioredoxin family protein [Candidatus Kapabacteria bacterium]|nr:thioredoxin family protein [Candidatus Kapabacteria bacterium]